MLPYIHKFVAFKNKYKEMLSSIADSSSLLTTTDWPTFLRLSNDRLHIVSVTDLLPESQFYEIERSYRLRNIFVPILTFGFEKEFARVMQLFSEKGLARKFELKPGYFKDLVLSFDIERDPAKQTYPHQVKKWEDPLTYITRKNACISCDFSKDFSGNFVDKDVSVNILKKDYSEYLHRESRVEKDLMSMKESGLFESQKSKYLKILSTIKDTNKVIATEDWPSFMRRAIQFKILPINDVLNESKYAYLIRNVFVPIISFGLHSELARVVYLLKEIGLAKKFELKPGYFKYLVKEMDITSNRFADPVSFFDGDRTVGFGFSEGTVLILLIKDYDEYFLRRKDAENSLWGVQKYTCQYCGRVAEHIDHIMPLSKGGNCEHDNLALSCETCNLHKQDRTPEEAEMPLVRDFAEIDAKWVISSEKYFKSRVHCIKNISVRPNMKMRYYEITLFDKLTGEIISEHIADTKHQAFWKFIELYESLNPNYKFSPYSRVDSAMWDRRHISLSTVEEELKANIEPLKAKLKIYIKRADKLFPVLDVYSNLIQEITCSENHDLNAFCCSICKQSNRPLADISFSFYIKSPQEHFDRLDTVICESCSKGFTERHKVKMGKYWVDIIIGNKWHSLESFVKKRIGSLRANYIGNIAYRLTKRDLEPFELEKLAEYIYLLDFCWKKGFKVSSWKPKEGFNILELVNSLPRYLLEQP